LDRATGKVVRTLSDNVSAEQSWAVGANLAWSPDGAAIAFLDFSPKRIARRLAVVPAAGGKPAYPLAAYRGTPYARLEWGPDSRHLRVQPLEATRNRLLRVDVTGSISPVADDILNFWGWSMSRDGRVVLLTAETGRSPPNLLVVEGRKSRQ